MRSGTKQGLGWLVGLGLFVACAPSEILPDTHGYADAAADRTGPSDASIDSGSFEDAWTATDSGQSLRDSTTPLSDMGQPEDSGKQQRDHHAGSGDDADVGDTSVGADSSRDSAGDADAQACALLQPATQAPIVGGGASWILAADLNDDGNPDLAMAATGLEVLLGHGDGTFGSAVSYPAPYAHGLVAADLDRDGRLDLVVADTGDPSLGDQGAAQVFIGNGDGTFKAAVAYPAGPAPYGVTVADFDGDGKPDLAVSDALSYGYAGVSVLVGNGDGTFQAAKAYGFALDAGQIASADFNGDGKQDVVFADNSGLEVVLGRGDGTFQTQVAYGPPTLGVVVADFNLDGVPDLANANGLFLLGNGDGTFGHPFTSPAGSGFMGIGDINGDGKPDGALIDAVLLGNGDGTFQGPVNFVAGNAPFAAVSADFNLDGRADIAVANSGSPYVSIFLSCR